MRSRREDSCDAGQIRHRLKLTSWPWFALRRNWAIAQLPCEQGSPNNGLSNESKVLNRKSREEKIYQEDIVTASGKF